MATVSVCGVAASKTSRGTLRSPAEKSSGILQRHRVGEPAEGHRLRRHAADDRAGAAALAVRRRAERGLGASEVPFPLPRAADRGEHRRRTSPASRSRTTGRHHAGLRRRRAKAPRNHDPRVRGSSPSSRPLAGRPPAPDAGRRTSPPADPGSRTSSRHGPASAPTSGRLRLVNGAMALASPRRRATPARCPRLGQPDLLDGQSSQPLDAVRKIEQIGQDRREGSRADEELVGGPVRQRIADRGHHVRVADGGRRELEPPAYASALMPAS